MTFTQLNARLKNFLRGWLFVLCLKECLVECATLCAKSEVILSSVVMIQDMNCVLLCIKNRASVAIKSLNGPCVRCLVFHYDAINLK